MRPTWQEHVAGLSLNDSDSSTNQSCQAMILDRLDTPHSSVTELQGPCPRFLKAFQGHRPIGVTNAHSGSASIHHLP